MSRLSGGRLVLGAGVGSHYTVRLDRAAPEPHPIPIWIASSSGHPRVIARAAANDGIFPIADHTLRPHEISALVDAGPP